MIHFLFAILGFLVGGLMNVLADDLPERRSPLVPHCYNKSCNYSYSTRGWFALFRLISYRWQCPKCDAAERRRTIVVELITIAIFAVLPLFVTDIPNLIIDTIFVSILILVIVIDLEHRLILTVVTFPTTMIAIFALSWFHSENNFILSISGAFTGFIIFYLLYLMGVWFFGEGALGFGDVMLSMTMGAMLGIHMIVPALLIGILLGGLGSVFLLIGRTVGMSSYTPYGQYLATGGIIALIWGPQIVEWYFG